MSGTYNLPTVNQTTPTASHSSLGTSNPNPSTDIGNDPSAHTNAPYARDGVNASGPTTNAAAVGPSYNEGSEESKVDGLKDPLAADAQMIAEQTQQK